MHLWEGRSKEVITAELHMTLNMGNGITRNNPTNSRSHWETKREQENKTRVHCLRNGDWVDMLNANLRKEVAKRPPTLSQLKRYPHSVTKKGLPSNLFSFSFFYLQFPSTSCCQLEEELKIRRRSYRSQVIRKTTLQREVHTKASSSQICINMPLLILLCYFLWWILRCIVTLSCGRLYWYGMHDKSQLICNISCH